VVIWHSIDQDGSSYGIFGQRYGASGLPLGPEFRVNSYTTGHQRNPRVAVSDSGGFVVVWNSEQLPGGLDDAFGQRYDGSGAPVGPEFRINTAITGISWMPSVASDSAGNFVVVWQGDGSGGPGIWGQRFLSSGAPLGSDFRINTYTPVGGNATVAMAPAGDFVVVWDNQTPNVGHDIFGQMFTSAGVPVGSQFRVNTYTTGYQEKPAVATDAAGNFVVVWDSGYQDGSQWGIFGQRFASAGTPLGAEFRVNATTGLTQWSPGFGIASDADGNFVVAWYDSFNGDPYGGIFARRFASSGMPAGPEFRVNTYTTRRQNYAAVAADGPSGNFVVVWRSYLQDGSKDGVFAQRYGQIFPVELTSFRVD